MLLKAPLTSLGIVKERIRQAKWSFNLAITATTLSAVIGVISIVLLLSGKVTDTVGSLTSVGGSSLSFCCLKLAKDANDRMDKLIKLDDIKED